MLLLMHILMEITAHGTHSAVINANPEYPYLTLKIGVTGGTLVNPTVQLKTLSGSAAINYTLPFSKMTNNIKSVDETNKIIYFNDITNSSPSTHNYYKFGMQISTIIGDSVDISKLNEDSVILFTATYKDLAGNTYNISKEIYINVGWTADLTMGLDQRVTKYIANDDKTINIQTTIFSKINSANLINILPVKQSKIVVDVPTYQGIEPSKVEVSAVKTTATNGKDQSNVVFDSSNWSYDSTTKQITITVDNPLDNNKAVSKRGTDEFVISYTYPEAAYNLIDLTGVNLKNKISGVMTLYSNNTTTNITKSLDDHFTLTEYIGAKSGSVPKSFLYLNTFGESLRKIKYTCSTVLYLAESGALLSHKYILNASTFSDGTNSFPALISGVNYIPIVDFYVSVQEFSEFFGADGYIKIYDQNDTLLNTISASSTTETINGVLSYKIDIPEETARNIEKYTLITSTPTNDLTALKISYHRAIQTDLPYTIAQIQKFKTIDETVNFYSARGNAGDAINYTHEKDLNLSLNLADTDTNASFNLETTTLKNSNEAQTIIANILLDNAARTDSDLWENPVFAIELPEYVTSFDGNVNIQISNIEGFSVVADELNIIKKDNKFNLVFKLDGSQKNIYANPTKIRVEFKVFVDKFTPSVTKDINLYYYNALAYQYRNPSVFKLDPSNPVCGIATDSIDLITEPTLLCVSELSNFNSTGDVIDSFDENTVGNISLDGAEATMGLIIQNNHTVPVSDISVLGRIPYINNKSILGNNDLGTKINTILTTYITKVSNIDDSKYTVYYSDNLDATKDLTNTTNNWVTTPTDLSTIKSFMIVLNNYELAVGEQLKFNYKFSTSNSLKYNKSLFANFGAYYTYDGNSGSNEANKIGLTTGNGPILRVVKTSSIPEGTSVKEGDLITYTITVYNDGNVPAKNVVIKDTIPQYTTYAQEENGQYIKNSSISTVASGVVETLGAGENCSLTFSVIVNEIEKHDAYITNTSKVTADGLDEISSNTINIPTTPTEKNPSLRTVKTSSVSSGTAVKEGDIITYRITVYNDGNAPAYNVVIHDTVPANTTYVEFDTTTNQYVEKPSTTSITSVAKEILAAGESFNISFSVKVNAIANSNTKITNTATVTANDLDDVSSNTVTISTKETIKKPILSAVKTSSIQNGASVKEGDIITYRITVYNSGNGPAKNVVIKDTIPENTTYVELDSNNNYIEKASVKTISSNTKGTLEAGQNFSFEFSVKVNKISDENVKIVNTAKVTADDLDEISSNTVTITTTPSPKLPKLRVVKTSSIQDGSTVKEGKIITYKITVYNDGEGDAKNVIIHDTVPEHTTYVEKDSNNEYVKKASTTTITSNTRETLAPGESFSETFTVMVDKIENENTIITNTAKVTADNSEDVSSNTVRISAEKSESSPIIPDTGNKIVFTSLLVILVLGLTSSVITYLKLKKLTNKNNLNI